MELSQLLNEGSTGYEATDERPTKMARHNHHSRLHGETVYMHQSAALESSLRSSTGTWRPHFRHWSTEAGPLVFECRWPSCDHRSSTVEADTDHLESHIVRRQSHAFRARALATLRDEVDLATIRNRRTAPRVPALALPPAPAPARCISPPPCTAVVNSESTPQQWRTSRARTGNRIPLDRRASIGVASAQFKCEWPNCTYIALRRSHLIQHELTHTGARPFACTWPNCTYRASRNATLAEHMRTHTGHRPFKCTFPGCSYAAAQRTTLSSHMRRHRKR